MTTTAGGVLLVDLENMVGQKAKSGIVAARMQVLMSCAGPGVKVVAACARARITSASTQVLHDHDVALLTVDGSKDAADEALLAEAQRLAGDGYRRFVVASNDSRFTRLADLGDLEIIIWTTQKPRKNYTARASKVHRLPIPAGSATPATSSPPAKRPAPATPKKVATTGPNTVRTATTSPQRHGNQPPSLQRPSYAAAGIHPVTAGMGLLAAGVIFGAGTALGDLAVRQLFGCLKRFR